MILIKILSKSLGDTLASLHVCDIYRRKKSGGSEVFVSCNFSSFLSESFPYLNLLSYDSPIQELNGSVFCSGLRFDEIRYLDYKFHENLISGYARQLGVCDRDIFEAPPILSHAKDKRSDNRRICFSMHSTAQAKHWNYPLAWEKLAELHISDGYDVVNVDKYSSFGVPGNMNEVPDNCSKMNNLDLFQVCEEINECDYFVGISSGLSWIAHFLGKPVVMISGFTNVDHEFYKKTLRVGSSFSCNSCMNNPKYRFDPSDWLWCPEFKGTSSEFGCTKFIDPLKVYQEIKEWETCGFVSKTIRV